MTPRTRRRLLAVGGVLVLALLLLFLLWPSGPESGGATDASREPPRRPAAPSPWAATTVSYPPDCPGDCQRIGRLRLGHAVGEVELWYAPSIDDPIAQWADCVDSILECFEAGPREASAFPPCVEAADCPDACKAAFREAAAGIDDLVEMADALEATFLEPGAACAVPEDAS